MLGCAGKTLHYSPGLRTLITEGNPHQTLELPTDGSHPEYEAAIKRVGWNPAYHFALVYSPALAQPVDSFSRSLPDPHGMSGTVVWNTRRIESLQDGRF